MRQATNGPVDTTDRTNAWVSGVPVDRLANSDRSLLGSNNSHATGVFGDAAQSVWGSEASHSSLVWPDPPIYPPIYLRYAVLSLVALGVSVWLGMGL